MKRIALLLFSTLIFAASCEKEQTKNSCSESEQPKEPALLSINISTPATKASGSEHGNSASDSKINSLDILIFNNAEGAEYGLIEVYKNFTGDQLSDLSNIKILTTTGQKKLFIIGNSHISNTLKSITKYSDFQAIESSLLKENTGDFCMIYTADREFSYYNSLTANLARFVSRIKLGSLKTNFVGGPFEGMSLNNVKIYLLNAHSTKLMHDGKEPNNGRILNYKQANISDYQNSGIESFLYEAIDEPLTPTGEITSRYFYCYENLIDSETALNRYTRLVIEGELNGKTYYYPISINRNMFGYVHTNRHCGVQRNTSYTINCVISGVGSNNPDHIIEKKTITISVNITDWEEIGETDINF